MDNFIDIKFKFKDGFLTKRFDKGEPSQLYFYLDELKKEKKYIYEIDIDYD